MISLHQSKCLSPSLHSAHPHPPFRCVSRRSRPRLVVVYLNWLNFGVGASSECVSASLRACANVYICGNDSKVTHSVVFVDAFFDDFFITFGNSISKKYSHTLPQTLITTFSAKTLYHCSLRRLAPGPFGGSAH